MPRTTGPALRVRACTALLAAALPLLTVVQHSAAAPHGDGSPASAGTAVHPRPLPHPGLPGDRPVRRAAAG
ncbi:hypothetical protein [Kitasatospora sp. NPDC094015]|uniref:hypothetical protein n=1 Tax=Kitasatospora sp. NPDC094015 TaxID=3155205 RepID=UPI003323B0DF